MTIQFFIPWKVGRSFMATCFCKLLKQPTNQQGSIGYAFVIYEKFMKFSIPSATIRMFKFRKSSVEQL